MQLKIRHHTLDLSTVAANILQTGSHSAPSYLGRFHHFSGLLETHYSLHWNNLLTLEDLLADLQTVAQIADPDARLSKLVRRTTIVHELRHFHDCYCTPAGIDLLKRHGVLYWVLAGYTHNSSKDRARRGKETQFPIFGQHTEDEAIPILGHLRRHSRDYLTAFSLVLGVEPLGQLAGFDKTTDFHLVDIMDGERLVQKLPCVGINGIINEEEQLVLWPLGLTLILEALALIEQGSWIASVGKEERDAFRVSFQTSVNPYTAIIGTLNRIFKNRGHRLDDSLIYELLWLSLFPRPDTNDGGPLSQGFVAAKSGWEVIRLLSENLHFADSGEVDWDPPEADLTWRDTQSLYSSPLYKYSYENFYLPAMTLVENSAIRFATQDWYTAYLGSLPVPQLVLDQTGKLTVASEQFYSIWVNHIFHQSVVEHAVFSTIFVCPVRHPETTKYFPQAIYPSGQTCQQGIRDFSCGIWRPGTPYRGAACAWTHHMEQILGRRGDLSDEEGALEWPWDGPGTPKGVQLISEME